MENENPTQEKNRTEKENAFASCYTAHRHSLHCILKDVPFGSQERDFDKEKGFLKQHLPQNIKIGCRLKEILKKKLYIARRSIIVKKGNIFSSQPVKKVLK
jgi:hypothetical protein